MAGPEFEHMTVLEKYRHLTTEEGCEPAVAATLVLASAVEGIDVGRLLDSAGILNVQVSGDIETKGWYRVSNSIITHHPLPVSSQWLNNLWLGSRSLEGS